MQYTYSTIEVVSLVGLLVDTGFRLFLDELVQLRCDADNRILQHWNMRKRMPLICNTCVNVQWTDFFRCGSRHMCLRTTIHSTVKLLL